MKGIDIAVGVNWHLTKNDRSRGGPKFAKRIVQKFGMDTFTIIEDNAELLIEVEGIGRKRVQMIAESWEQQKEIKNVMLFLQDHGVSISFAVKIYKQYGNNGSKADTGVDAYAERCGGSCQSESGIAGGN